MLIGDALVLLVVIGVIVWGLKTLNDKSKEKRLLANAPAGALAAPGDNKHEIKAKTEQYKLLLKSVRILEDQIHDPDIRPLLPEEMRKDMKSVVDDFFNR